MLVCGITRDELHLSGRTTRTDLDLGDSFVDTNGTEAELVERIRRRLETRFFETVPDGVVESDV